MKRAALPVRKRCGVYYAIHLDRGVMMGGEHREDAALLHAADQDLILYVIGIIVHWLARLVAKQQVFADGGAVR